jgi:glutaredoxin 3
MNIVIYTKSNCPNCVAAKQLLDSKGLAYSTIDLDDPYKLLAFTSDNPGIRQMPQIYIDTQRVGGLEGLKAALTQLGL